MTAIRCAGRCTLQASCKRQGRAHLAQDGRTDRSIHSNDFHQNAPYQFNMVETGPVGRHPSRQTMQEREATHTHSFEHAVEPRCPKRASTQGVMTSSAVHPQVALVAHAFDAFADRPEARFAPFHLGRSHRTLWGARTHSYDGYGSMCTTNAVGWLQCALPAPHNRSRHADASAHGLPMEIALTRNCVKSWHDTAQPREQENDTGRCAATVLQCCRSHQSLRHEPTSACRYLVKRSTTCATTTCFTIAAWSPVRQRQRDGARSATKTDTNRSQKNACAPRPRAL